MQFVDRVGVFINELCEIPPNVASEKLPNFPEKWTGVTIAVEDAPKA
jgi:hypothetical protein